MRQGSKVVGPEAVLPKSTHFCAFRLLNWAFINVDVATYSICSTFLTEISDAVQVEIMNKRMKNTCLELDLWNKY